MNFQAIIDSALKVAHAVAPLVPYGSEAIAAVDAVRGMLDDVKEAAIDDPTAVKQIEAGRAEFEAAVNAHADKTLGDLADES